MRNLAFCLGLWLASAAAWAGQGEFGNQCAMGLTMGKNVATDCSINMKGTDGKTYCFGNEEAKAAFSKDPEGNLKKAQEFYARSQPKS
jgi:YHS domain-containing protein